MLSLVGKEVNDSQKMKTRPKGRPAVNPVTNYEPRANVGVGLRIPFSSSTFVWDLASARENGILAPTFTTQRKYVSKPSLETIS